MTNRRTEPRMMCADMVDVRWSDRSGRRRSATALLEDISAHGACLQLEAPISLGTEIRWVCPRKEFRGCVRYCVYREIGYFVFEKGVHTAAYARPADTGREIV